jgi:hypothetical protein
MWTAHTERPAGSRLIKFAIERDSSPVTYSDVLRLWQHDAGFRV